MSRLIEIALIAPMALFLVGSAWTFLRNTKGMPASVKLEAASMVAATVIFFLAVPRDRVVAMIVFSIVIAMGLLAALAAAFNAGKKAATD